MKTIFVRRKTYLIDDNVMDEFMVLRSRQAKLWKRVRVLKVALEKALPFVMDEDLCKHIKSILIEDNK